MASSSRAITRKKIRALVEGIARRSGQPAIEDVGLIDAVTEHVARYVGGPIHVIHEERSRFVHVDVHVVPPGRERPWFTLVTSGMAAAPMLRWCEHGVSQAYSELVMRLPEGWPVKLACGEPLPRDETARWPFDWLADLARMPHEQQTLFDRWHSTEHFDPLPGTRFTGSLLLPVCHPPGMGELVLPPEACLDVPFPRGAAKAMRSERWTVTPARRVKLLQVFPLFPEEIDYKLQHGAMALIERLRDGRIDPRIANPRRRSACPRPG